MRLDEIERPKTWSEVVAQDDALKQINIVRKTGLSGRAFLISGKSGTGKTTIAKLIANEVAEDWNIIEVDAREVTAKYIQELEDNSRAKRIGAKNGVAIIINECHGLREAAITQLLTTLEGDRIPSHVVWLFTTTVDGQEKLFADAFDAVPFASRCTRLNLAQRNISKAFAARCKAIAEKHGLGGKPISAYERLVNDNASNMRAALSLIETGAMMAE